MCIRDRVHIGDMHRPEIVRGTVILELPSVPTAAVIAIAAVAVTIINATIVPDMRTPVAIIEGIRAIIPGPVGRGPIHAFLRRLDPGARHPVIAFRAISPVARGPYITFRRHGRLLVHRQHRRRDRDRESDHQLRVRNVRHRQNQRPRKHGRGN